MYIHMNIYIYIHMAFDNNNNNLRGGRPASTRVASPYGEQVITGKPGIMLAPPCFGFSESPLPALCRRANSCAWRPRLRKMLDQRPGCRCGHAEVRSGGHPWVGLTAQTVAKRKGGGAAQGRLGGGGGGGGGTGGG